jgi:hypothetical protein
VNILVGKGVALAALGDEQDALVSLNKALTIDPTNQMILNLKVVLQGWNLITLVTFMV